MKKIIIGALALVAFCTGANASKFSTENKVALQAIMQHHVQKNLVDGVYPNVKLKNGKVSDLAPTKSHAMVVAIGGGYVLCTDFRDSEGQSVNVDFYITSKNGRFMVFQTEIDNRAPLNKLIASGKASLLK